MDRTWLKFLMWFYHYEKVLIIMAKRIVTMGMLIPKPRLLLQQSPSLLWSFHHHQCHTKLTNIVNKIEVWTLTMDIVNWQTSTFAPAATLSFTILSTLSSCLPLFNMISIRLELSWCSSWSVLDEVVIESHLELIIGPIVVPAFSPSPTFRSSTAFRNLLKIGRHWNSSKRDFRQFGHSAQVMIREGGKKVVFFRTLS